MVPPRRLLGGDYSEFQRIGEEFRGYFVELGGLEPHHAVLDVGCGPGRMAVPLMDYLTAEGRYEGFDVVPREIRWCQEHITPRRPNFEQYRTALLGRAPFVTAIVADVDVAGLVAEAGNIATPIKTADLLDSDETLEADDGAGTDRSMTADADAGDPGPPEGEITAAGRTMASEYQASHWNGRTRVYGGGKKNNYIGLAWNQPGTLKWYQGDDAHDRGYEPQARVKPGTATWSDDWADGWKSNLPDAYRDDLTSDDDYKKFAVGSANGKALKYRKKYFAWYNTDDGGPDSGTVLEEGQRTTRPRNVKQRTYCTGRGGGDKYCFFENGTNVIQEYPIENRYHRVRKSWP